MAARKPTKASMANKAAAAKPAPSKAVRPSAVAGRPAVHAAVERLEATVAELSSARDALTADLATARARIAVLEAARLDAINRIDWAIDSLRSAIQK